MTLAQALLQIGADVSRVADATFSVAGLQWILITLVCYTAALALFRLAGGSPWLHPLVITATGVGMTLYLTETSIADFQTYAGIIHWLLGPATVALAIPMYNQWQQVRDLGWHLLVSVMAGGILAPLLAWTTLYLLDAPLALQMTMLVKSITTPLAMEASANIGGVPALAAVFVITTGIVGAVVTPAVFHIFRVTGAAAQGVALGTVAHAVGTAKALQMSEQAGAMATLGLCLNGIVTAVILPLML
ncbi:LrgB family protein [Alteromonas sp. ASW11-19]|uniref:LrgB family protein n=1 Tax=Alteromonas salexigens TaxID=2982530 RepID=A0ABT2VNM9_9ALTE|nr:LrgB family protein [Alteromonas salexigens]MCU7554839.1 LrgB family protein [Alteromonas salexigens]